MTHKKVVGDEGMTNDYAAMAFDNDDLEVPTFLRRKADGDLSCEIGMNGKLTVPFMAPKGLYSTNIGLDEFTEMTFWLLKDDHILG